MPEVTVCGESDDLVEFDSNGGVVFLDSVTESDPQCGVNGEYNIPGGEDDEKAVFLACSHVFGLLSLTARYGGTGLWTFELGQVPACFKPEFEYLGPLPEEDDEAYPMIPFRSLVPKGPTRNGYSVTLVLEDAVRIERVA